MLPLVSATLMLARAMRRLSMSEVAMMAGVRPADVFHAENFPDNVDPLTIDMIAVALEVDLFLP